MSLTVYFDDSGTDAANTHFVIAGFASSVDQWGRFEDEWKLVLDEFGIPFFKAKQFDDGRRGQGIYKDWSEKDRREFMGRLLGVIKRRAFKSFGTVTKKIAFETLTENRDLKSYFRSVFSFSVFNCVHAVTEWRNQYHPGLPVLFVFDEGNKNAGDVKESARYLRLHPDDRMIEDITPGDDRKLPPLQAADLLAFELCAEKRREVARPKAYTRHPLLMLEEHPKDWMDVDESALVNHVISLINSGVMKLSDNKVNL